MKRILATLSLPLLLSATTQAQTGIASPAMYKSDTLIRNFLNTWNIPGATVSITRNGKLIYNRAFGHADQAKTEVMQPWHLQRIASNSKPITAIAVMKLIEDGKLKLTDVVFGPGRIIDDSYYTSAITDNRIYSITVQHLLEHTAGWDRDQPCDGYTNCDPIGFPLHVTSSLGEGNPVKDSTLIKFLLKKGLNNAPGTKYAYSNIGYLVLAKVIERVTGMRYDAYVTSVIMTPLGLDDMHLGRNLLADKQEREAEYTNAYTTQSCYGTGATVPWQYGGWNLEAMHAHGGWISSSEDYVRMILAVDKQPNVPDILLPATVDVMTTALTANANYAKGWSVNAAGNWWHMGSLDGTSSFMAKTANGFTWAIHLNARDNLAAFTNALDALPWNCIASTTTYPTFDLFAPKTNASNVTAVRTGTGTAHVSWNAGSGDGRAVLVTEGSAWKSFPVAGTTYTAAGDFSTATNLGNGVMLAYSGTANSVDITNLDPTKTYRFTVLEWYRNAVTENNTVYKYGGRSEAGLNMSATAINPVAGAAGQVSIHPNPAQQRITLECSNPALIGTILQITDLSGRKLRSMPLAAARILIPVQDFQAGVYFLRFADGSSLKMIKQ